jgi:hypothetical protein
MYTWLQELELDRLSELTKGLINRGQIKALLKRRDLIIEKIERDRAEFGDESVFLTGSP